MAVEPPDALPTGKLRLTCRRCRRLSKSFLNRWQSESPSLRVPGDHRTDRNGPSGRQGNDMRSRRARRITVVFAAALLGTAALAPSAGASAFPGTNGPIVFAHSPGNGQSIWITNPDGSGTHALTSPPSGFFDASPRFSADGAW